MVRDTFVVLQPRQTHRLRRFNAWLLRSNVWHAVRSGLFFDSRIIASNAGSWLSSGQFFPAPHLGYTEGANFQEGKGAIGKPCLRFARCGYLHRPPWLGASTVLLLYNVKARSSRRLFRGLNRVMVAGSAPLACIRYRDGSARRKRYYSRERKVEARTPVE